MKTRSKIICLAISVFLSAVLILAAVKLPYGELSRNQRMVLIPAVAIWTLAAAWLFWKGTGPRSKKAPPTAC